MLRWQKERRKYGKTDGGVYVDKDCHQRLVSLGYDRCGVWGWMFAGVTQRTGEGQRCCSLLGGAACGTAVHTAGQAPSIPARTAQWPHHPRRTLATCSPD